MVRYRKSKKVGPFRLTVSQRGISSSIGTGPVRISLGADGRVRRTVRIPGSGISDTRVVAGTESERTDSDYAATVLAGLVVLVLLAVVGLFNTGHWPIAIVVIAAFVAVLGYIVVPDLIGSRYAREVDYQRFVGVDCRSCGELEYFKVRETRRLLTKLRIQTGPSCWNDACDLHRRWSKTLNTN